MDSPLLQASDLWKSYDGHRQVLRGVNLSLETGGGMLVWGRNGSGKTTLLNLLGCLDLPDRGTILLDGQELTSLSASRRARVRLTRLGFMFQEHNLLEELTVRQNVLLPLKLARDEDAQGRAAALLRRFGLESLGDRRPREISVGESQKVAIARALGNEPQLLLADEPTASLDEESAKDLLGLLEELRREGTAVLLASHDSLSKDLHWQGFMISEGLLRAIP